MNNYSSGAEDAYFDANAGYGLFETFLTVSPCNENNFLFENFSKVEEIGIRSYHCINEQELINLNGLYLMENYTFLTIDIKKCVNSTENENHCKSDEEIQEFFEKYNEV